MPRFSQRSLGKLNTCHTSLQALFNEVIAHFDCTVLEGHRTEARQRRLYEQGKSKTLDSKHMRQPSLAVDVAPCPVDWRDTDRFYYFGGFVQGMSKGLGIEIRWGGDWDQDTQVSDNEFDDLVHFELAT